MNATNEKYETLTARARPTNQNNNMRKYQQLALTLISIVSLIAFLFYKHEYDRLRYVFEYLETFGTVDDENLVNSCGISLHRKLTTPPTSWVVVHSNRIAYSAFFNDTAKPKFIGVLGVQISDDIIQDVSTLIWDSDDGTEHKSICKSRTTFHDDSSIILRCELSTDIHNPYLMQFETAASPIFIQEIEKSKNLKKISCACILTAKDVTPTSQIIEFIAYHHALGIEKFVFYGNILTSMSRKLLDRYGEEVGLFYEEKHFNVPPNFKLTEKQKHNIIESDCVYRHRNTHENIITLKLNEYVIAHNLTFTSLVQPAFSNDHKKTQLPQVGILVQDVCIEKKRQKGEVLLSLKMRKIGKPFEKIMIHHPHLSNFLGLSKPNITIPLSLGVIQRFVPCDSAAHKESDLLPSNKQHQTMIKKSMLYRKSTVYY